tara:strand:- start:81 stop:983 length:903 start_codon:yes stop_codon:yes gene_type:complete
MTTKEKEVQDRANGKGIYDFLSKAGDDLLDSVASAADSVQSLQDKGILDATTTKMYARSVLENLNPFDPTAATEEDLNDGELKVIRSIVSGNVNSGSSKIGYGDYGKAENKLGYGVSLPDISSPHESAKLLLGQANIRRDKNGNLFVIDSYDFNAPEEEKNASVFDRAAMFYDDYTTKNMSFYGSAHRFGELFGESIPVKINLGAAEGLGISKEQLNKIPLLASESNKEEEDSLQVAIAESLNESGVPNLEDLEQKTYNIQKGDTLSKIAQRNNTTVAELVDKNSITNPDMMYTGETLIV